MAARKGLEKGRARRADQRALLVVSIVRGVRCGRCDEVAVGEVGHGGRLGPPARRAAAVASC